MIALRRCAARKPQSQGFCKQTFRGIVCDVLGLSQRVRAAMSLFRHKIINHRAAFSLVVFFLFGALVVLGAQARLSLSLPLEGCLKYLSSAARMIDARSTRSDQIQQPTDDRAEQEPCGRLSTETVLVITPPPPVVFRRDPARTTYYLRPPPHRLSARS